MTFEELIDEMKPFHNDIVISGDKLLRLIGVGDSKYDFHYLCREIGGRFIRMTAVTFCESIKNKIDQRHYDCLDSTFELNGAPKTDEFYIEYIDEGDSVDRLKNEIQLRKIFNEPEITEDEKTELLNRYKNQKELLDQIFEYIN